MFNSIRTADDLKDRPAGWSFGQHLNAVRAAQQEHALAASAIANSIEDDPHRTEWMASERRDFDRHTDEVRRLESLDQRLAESPEGREVDLNRVLPVGGGEFRADGHEPRWTHSGGGHVYERDNRQVSFTRDLCRAMLHGDGEARQRLERNNREVAATPEFRALSGTNGAGGEFVPPLWAMAEWIRLARAGRVVADSVQRAPLPAGTDSISLPRLATGTATAEQATQNTAVQNTDATTNSVTADVVTLAGQQVLSYQLADQSPANAGDIILQDLLADLATKVDTFAISNNATNKVGILNVSGLNAVTYTDASPTVSELYPKIADAIQRIHTGRFLPPSRIFMHPRRWAWATAASDTAGRPLVVPAAQMPQNVAAAFGAVASEGFVGSIQGIPTYVDPNIPTNLGTGTDEDRIIVMRAEDTILYESGPRVVVTREALANQLSVLLVVHEYVALHASRYPKSISVIGGTGLATPTF